MRYVQYVVLKVSGLAIERQVESFLTYEDALARIEGMDEDYSGQYEIAKRYVV